MGKRSRRQVPECLSSRAGRAVLLSLVFCVALCLPSVGIWGAEHGADSSLMVDQPGKARIKLRVHAGPSRLGFFNAHAGQTKLSWFTARSGGDRGDQQLTGFKSAKHQGDTAYRAGETRTGGTISPVLGQTDQYGVLLVPRYRVIASVELYESIALDLPDQPPRSRDCS